MSLVFSLQIPMDQLPAPIRFINELAGNWVELYEDEPDVHALHTLGNTILPICPMLDEYGDEAWLYDHSYTFYLSNVSTRGLEVWYRADAFSVRVLTLASPEEWEFAFQMLEIASAGENALVSTDWEPSTLRVHELREQFDEERIREALRLQLGTILNAVLGTQEGTLDLDGPVNVFSMGPWFCQRLLSAYEEPNDHIDEILETILAAMRIVNYVAAIPDFEGIVGADVEEIQLPNGDVHIAAHIEAEQRYFIPAVDSLIVSHNDQSTSIPQKHFKKYLGKYFKRLEELIWLDEYQFILQPLSPERFAKFAKAAASDFSPEGKRRKGIVKMFNRN